MVILPVAFAVMAGLLAAGLALSVWLAPVFAVVVGLYVLVNAGYSLGLKRLSIVDVMAIALGFVLRVYAGGTLIEVRPTVWIIAGILRYLQITLVEERSGSPTLVALTDRFLLIAMGGWIAVFAWLIYG
jgi:4-hydroxybenzoate polyprenyltransferase